MRMCVATRRRRSRARAPEREAQSTAPRAFPFHRCTIDSYLHARSSSRVYHVAYLSPRRPRHLQHCWMRSTWARTADARYTCPANQPHHSVNLPRVVLWRIARATRDNCPDYQHPVDPTTPLLPSPPPTCRPTHRHRLATGRLHHTTAQARARSTSSRGADHSASPK